MTTPTETLLSRAEQFITPSLLWVMPEPGAGLKKIPGLRVAHTFRPAVLALQRMGIKADSAWPADEAPVIALTLPRQAEWAFGLLARALERLPSGAVLLAAARNDRGGKRYVSLLEEHFGSLWADSKNHCRMIALERPARLPAIVADWTRSYAPKIVAGTDMLALPGTFSCDHIDKGSALLAAQLPVLSGRVADFGAGWGYLSRHVLTQSPAISHLDLYEADANALAMAASNLKSFEGKTGFFWLDILSESAGQNYDAVIMNPPFHDLQDPDPSIGRGFIAAAAAALKTGGALWMVANRHLPYEETLAEEFSSWRSVATDGGFKILTASR